MTDNPQDPQSTGGQPAEPPIEGGGPPAADAASQPEQGATEPAAPAPAEPPAPETPSYGAPQPPSYGAPQPPSYGAPQQPSYGAPDQAGGFPPPPAPPAPQFGAPPGGPQQPGYGAPQQPGQQPGYGAPQQGFPSAPPPPAYGQYGAPGGPGGPAGPWGAPPSFSAGGAVGWAFRAYGSNVGFWLLWMLILLVVGALLSLIFLPSVTDLTSGDGLTANYNPMQMDFGARVLQAILGLILTALGLILYQGALHKVNGRLSSFGDFLKFDHFGPGLIAAVVVGVITNIVGVVPGIGGLLQLVATILLIFVVPLALDRGLGIGEALSQGIKLVTSNLGQVVLLYVIFIGLAIAGVIVICGTGLVFVVIPVYMLATTFGYKVLSGQQVAQV